MITKFKARILKGNNKGTGFVKIPPEKIGTLRTGDSIAVQLAAAGTREEFFGVVRTHFSSAGFFVPKDIMLRHDLSETSPEFIVEHVDGFSSKVGSDGRVYVPRTVAKKHRLKQHDVVLLASLRDDRERRFSLVTVRHKNDTTEYKCIFHKRMAGMIQLFVIDNLSLRKKHYSAAIRTVLKDFRTASIDDSHSVLFQGNRMSIVINDKIRIEDFVYYLGAFFADGTKRGNSWGICASTFEQAKYYLSMHKRLIADATLKIGLTYTDNKQEDINHLRKKLAKTWLKNTSVSVDPDKIRVLRTSTPNAANRNPYGSLVIKELRQSTMIYYNELLHYLLKTIRETKNRLLAQEFLCGVLEGDGAPSARSRGHIVITTNKHELKVLREIFAVAGFKHDGLMEGGNGASIRIGSLELLKNLPSLYDRLFAYYPKRKARFTERFLRIGTVRFLAGRQKGAAYWVLKELQKEGIIDERRSLTAKGERIRELLLEMEKSVTIP